MDETCVTVYLCIPMPSMEFMERGNEGTSGSLRSALYDLLDELCGCTHELSFQIGSGIVNPSISLLSAASRKVLVSERILRKKVLSQCEVLVVSATVPVLHFSDAIKSAGKLENPVSPPDVACLLARIEFCKAISDLLVIANIAHVGAIELLDSVVVQNGERLKFGELPRMDAGAIQRAKLSVQKMGWPQLRKMPIKIAWDWMTRHHGMLEGFGGTRMGRALCAMSRLLERKTVNEPMQLLWALVGIEALYTRGQSGLLQQVRQKSQALLGPQESFKRRLSDMYDFRSRFVHGDLDFPGISLIQDARDEVARYSDELDEAVAVAVAVLIATIQEIMLRDWSGVSFPYSAVDDPST